MFITHDIHYAKKAERIIVMKDGEIVECGTTLELSKKCNAGYYFDLFCCLENSEFNKLSMKIKENEKEFFENDKIIEENTEKKQE